MAIDKILKIDHIIMLSHDTLMEAVRNGYRLEGAKENLEKETEKENNYLEKETEKENNYLEYVKSEKEDNNYNRLKGESKKIMNELVSLNGKSYNIWYTSPEERDDVINEILGYTQDQCPTCHIENQYGDVQSMAPTCPSTTKVVGDIITLSASPTSGYPPYVSYTFWRNDSKTKTTLSTGTAATYKYTITNADYLANQASGYGHVTFGVDVKDSCPTGGHIGTEYCTLSIGPACPSPVANLKIV